MERCRPFSVLILCLVLYEEQLVSSDPVIKSNLLFLHISFMFPVTMQYSQNATYFQNYLA